MATEARKFQLGVFIISATVIAVATLIWLGASRFFERTTRMVTYFSESVQGLEPGSAVKYRGVPAGRVEQIEIAPDEVLVQVEMSIESDLVELISDDPTMRAQLQLAGITGLRYIEIDRHIGDQLTRYPELSFEAPHPVIRSAPSSFKAIQAALEDIYKQVMAVDLGAISNDIRATLNSANAILEDERIPRILENLQTVTTVAQSLTKDLREKTADLELEPAVEKLTEASAEAKALFQDLRSGESGEQLRQAFDQVGQLAQSGRRFIGALEQTLDRLNRAAANLERLTEEVRSQPSRLLFSAPPEPRHPGAGR